jgi:hypothetical protein
VLFLDEAVYTQRSCISKTWRNRYAGAEFEKARQGFGAVAVAAVIDAFGVLQAYVVRDHSIDLDALLELSQKIKQRYGRKKVFVFLDNLPLHRRKDYTA